MVARPLLVFSPHLDDAVLSLGNVIAAHPGSVVVTVLAGMPGDEDLTTEWDTSCGFDNAGDSMRARWAEDEAAVAALGASAIHLDFLDRQYGLVDPKALEGAIAQIITAHPNRRLYGPLGVWHPDHRRVSNAYLAAVSTLAVGDAFVYGDVPHYAQPGGLDRRLAELRQQGVVVEDLVEVAGQSERKSYAVSLYESQLRALERMPIDLPELTAVVRCTSRR